jgi:hypothetical protein
MLVRVGLTKKSPLISNYRPIISGLLPVERLDKRRALPGETEVKLWWLLTPPVWLASAVIGQVASRLLLEVLPKIKKPLPHFRSANALENPPMNP